MLPDELYPRWYLALGAFVWGLVLGVVGMMFVYESRIRVVADNGQFFRWLPTHLLYIVPTVFLASIQVILRVRRHLRLQRQSSTSPTTV